MMLVGKNFYQIHSDPFRSTTLTLTHKNPRTFAVKEGYPGDAGTAFDVRDRLRLSPRLVATKSLAALSPYASQEKTTNKSADENSEFLDHFFCTSKSQALFI